MIAAWRIVKDKYRAEILSGAGAAAKGGRWNHRGEQLVYCSSSSSLAMMELLVHLSGEDLVALRFIIAEILIPDDLVETMATDALPEGWDRSPATSSRAIGSAWIASGRSCALRVPSAVNALEQNYLLNPRHAGFTGITIGTISPLPFDPRLKDPSPGA